jgi:hypothetical protein
LLETLKDKQKRFWKWASLSIGALFGEPGGGLIYRGLREMDERSSVDEVSLSEEAP